MVFNPTDDRQMAEDLARFAAAGIPVAVFINRMAGQALTFVGSDDVAIGHGVGQGADRRSGWQRPDRRPRGHAGCADQPATAASRAAARRWPSIPAIELLEPGVGYLPARAGAGRRWRELLAAHPEIDGVWTANDMMAFGAVDALAAAGRRAEVVGVNGLPEAIANIERGTMLATADFSALNIAAIATRAALRHLARRAGAAGDHGAGRADRPARTSSNGRCRWPTRPCPAWDEIVLGILSAMRAASFDRLGAACSGRPVAVGADAAGAGTRAGQQPASSSTAPAATTLMTLDGIGEVRADAIIRARPFKAKTELVERRLIPEALYEKIADKVMARPPPPAPPPPTTRPAAPAKRAAR